MASRLLPQCVSPIHLQGHFHAGSAAGRAVSVFPFIQRAVTLNLCTLPSFTLPSTFPLHFNTLSHDSCVSHDSRHYPDVEVIGTSYPIGPWRQAGATAASWGRNAVMALAVGGDTLFGMMGIQVPGWYSRVIAPNRMGWCMGENGCSCCPTSCF